MAFKEFPDIEAKLIFNSTNPYYIGNLAINRNPPHDSFAHAVAIPVESTGVFLGGTIRDYVDCYRYLKRDGKQELTEDQCLELMLKDMFPNEWFHAVIPDENKPDSVSNVLKHEEEVRVFLDKEGRKRVLFVPGERYTRDTWGFSYEFDDLKRIAPFRLPVKAMPEFIDIIEGLSTAAAIMRGGDDCNPVYLNDLFRRMSEPRFRGFLEGFVQRKYREAANHTRKILGGYMERYGFEIPTND